ncbi:MAG TPA: PP2C family serine/threonine-protein phosphatase, partial [Chloroflexota bacterium]|nr:PP2C family serine/threonine-protein phosphatase [Chloroflexota bacterium]
ARPPRAQWHLAAASVRGASHRRAGTPNQDAVRCVRAERGTVLALSDGHGSERCFRSDVGARLAVAVATRVVGGALGRDLTDLEVLDGIAREIVRQWEVAVRADLRLFPLTRGEERLAEERHPLLAYGATLCVAAVTPEHLLYLQLGDGDIVTVSARGGVARPLPPDERLFANQTTSLCSSQAAHEFRVGFQALDPCEQGGDAPAMILVATDGYANSFRDERGFLRVGPDLLEMVRTEGIEPVRECLPAWLDEASRLGSGDDVTVGLLIRDEQQ